MQFGLRFSSCLAVALAFLLPAREALAQRRKCYRCSFALDASAGYVMPIGLSPPGSPERGQAVAGGSFDVRLIPADRFVVPIIGGGLAAGIGPTPAPYRDKTGALVTPSTLIYGVVLLPGFGWTGDGSYTLTVRGAFAGVVQKIDVQGQSGGDAGGLLGLGAIADVGTCLHPRDGARLRVCFFAQPTIFMNGWAATSGLRLTAF